MALNRIAILGLGPSLEAYVDVVKRTGGRNPLFDEVWGINAVGDIINCDRIFHMDDVRIQEIRAAAKPESNIANMLKWMRVHKGPIYTSRSHPDYPGLVEYPLEDVINSTGGLAYFNSTAAYAVAFAVHLGVRAMTLFGMDFTYQNSHDAEKGRACVEFYLGIARSRGIIIGLPDNTTLLDGNATKQDRLYGYDTVDIEITVDEQNKFRLTKTGHERRLTADQIEARYDHSKHPNITVQAEQEKANG